MGDVVEFNCAYCGKTTDRPTGHVNRARARGLKLYCGRRCSGLGRRKPPKTKAQRTAEKRTYDMEYRRKNREVIKAMKAAYHRATYDPATARIERKKRAQQHVEYCRRPAYRQWKREYDRRLRAAEYGPFAEAYMLAIELNREIKSRSSNDEIRQQNQTNNKTQRRAREAREQERERRRHHSAAYGA